MLGLTAALLGLLGLLPTSPPWDEALTGTEHCIEWRNTSEKTNSSVHRRLMFVSIPNGATPKGGWPVYFSLVTDPFGFSASPGAARTDCGVITTPQIYDVRTCSESVESNHYLIDHFLYFNYGGPARLPT